MKKNTISKKLLTHEMCVKSNLSTLKIIGSILAMAMIGVPYIRETEAVLHIMSIIFCSLTALCGLVTLIRTIIISKKMKNGEYFLYLDKISKKEVNEGEYSTAYYLSFKHNKYQKSVSKTEYQKIKAGSLYYMLQLEGSKKAINAFAEDEYALDESLKDKFKTKGE